MGTNYYWYEEKKACECCGRPFEPLHIGKSSAGWTFSLHVLPEQGIVDLESWVQKWRSGGIIEDEYGRQRTVEDMLDIITKRSHPRGLSRHIGRRARYGGPTWDLIEGDFS